MRAKPAAPTFLSPYFLGAYAENDQLLERMLLQFVRDHVCWRRNFHPKDKPPVPTSVQFQPFYLDFVAKLDQELHLLSADLKQAAPLFHPGYLGHMASDVLLPGLLAQIITALYNPNNVCENVASSTVQKEIDAVRQLAHLFGMPKELDNRAWGFLTSGGTLANFSSFRNCTAIKYYRLALAESGKMIDINFPRIQPLAKALRDYSAWELLNLTVEEVIHLRKSYLDEVRNNGSAELFYNFVQAIRAERIEALGLT